MGRISTFKKSIVTQWRSIDRGILYSALLLMFFGLSLTFAAGPVVAERRNEWCSIFGQYQISCFIYKHTMFMPVGILVLIGMALLPVQWARRLSFLVFGGSLLGMVAVLLFGTHFQGASRWINVAGISVQPSEFAKPAFAVVVGWLLARSKLLHKSHGGIYACIAYLITCFLLYKQPDFGMLLTVTAIFGIELFLAGLPWKVIAFLVAAAASLVPAAYFMLEHVRNRIEAFLHPTTENAYQVRQSMETLRTAGWFGKGPGEGVVKYTLPDAHTDFIMAVSAEEFGFLVSSVIVMTFMYVLFKGTTLVRQNNNYFAQLAVGGLLAQIAFQAIVNLGSTLNLLPTKGMTLPLISYGGSSLVSMAFAFGLILALTKQQTFSRGLE